jgi:hypothetical protein
LFGSSCERGAEVAHLTLGNSGQRPDKAVSITPIRSSVKAVDLVIGHPGRTQHSQLDRWELD